MKHLQKNKDFEKTNIEFFLKPQKNKMITPFHQDNYFWNVIDANAINIWIACSEASKKNGGKIHPLQLSLDVQDAMNENDWLVIDGGNTHFWSEIAINIAGAKGKKLKGIFMVEQ